LSLVLFSMFIFLSLAELVKNVGVIEGFFCAPLPFRRSGEEKG